jgi:hypothetical protein
MPINPFPDSLEKQVIRIRDGFDIEDFRNRAFNGAKLKYFGLPSAELLDVLTWRDSISAITAVERIPDVHRDIMKTIFKNKLESICDLISGDINEILKEGSFKPHQLFNLDFYGGFVHKKADGSASVPDALKALIRRQAEARESFILIATFQLRDSDKVEYDEYINTIHRSLSKFPVSNLSDNIDFHISKGNPKNVYRLKVCFPAFVYFSGLPDFVFKLSRIYYYKNLVHFVIEMSFVSDKALGTLPDHEILVEILNMQVSDVEGRLVTTRTPKVPQITFAE